MAASVSDPDHRREAETATDIRPGCFTIGDWARDGDGVAFQFTCTRFGQFTETVTWPGEVLDRVPVRLFDLLALALGVSYFKASAPDQIRLVREWHGPCEAAFADALYGEGLGEFYVRNALAFPPSRRWSPPPPDGPLVEAVDTDIMPGPVLCAFGGGKDSHVAHALLRKAGYAPELVSASLSERTAVRLAAMTNENVTPIIRRLDPRLGEVNRQGALNGHVPITAINALLMAVLAEARGMALAAFANERSAEEPTLHHGGVAINHQYSKSLAFERVLAAALAEAGATAQVISVLRPASELWIGQQLAALPEVWPRFASCNRNFVFAGPAALAEGQRWCRRCAKCVFTALILAPFVTPDQHEGIFGGRVLDDPANLDLARQNVGLTDAKPWDCVGEVRESAAALWKAASCGYRDQIVVSSLATELERRFGEAALAAWYDAALKLDSRGRVPTPIHAEMLRG